MKSRLVLALLLSYLNITVLPAQNPNSVTIEYDIYVDDSTTWQTYYEYIPSKAIISIPTNVVIDKDGKVVDYLIGYKKDIKDLLDASIQKALGKE